MAHPIYMKFHISVPQKQLSLIEHGHIKRLMASQISNVSNTCEIYVVSLESKIKLSFYLL